MSKERIVKMKNQKINDIKKFRHLLKAETSEKEKEYKQARIAYEQSLKKLIISNITGKNKFEEIYQDSFDKACDCYHFESGDWAIDHLKTLEWMISDFEIRLKEGQSKVDEELLK